MVTSQGNVLIFKQEFTIEHEPEAMSEYEPDDLAVGSTWRP